MMIIFRDLVMLFQLFLFHLLAAIGLVVATMVFFCLQNLNFCWIFSLAEEESLFQKRDVPKEEFFRRTWPCSPPPPVRNGRTTNLANNFQPSMADQFRKQLSCLEVSLERKPASVFCAVNKFRRQSAYFRENGHAPRVIPKKRNVYLSSTVGTFRRQYTQLEENGQKYAPLIMLDRNYVSPSSTVDQFKRKFYCSKENYIKNVHKRKPSDSNPSGIDQYKKMSTNGEKEAGMVMLERKNVSLSRIKKYVLKKEEKKNSMCKAKVLKLKENKKRSLAATNGFELDWYLGSKRLKAANDVFDTTSCSRNNGEEKCTGGVEEVEDYMEVDRPMTPWDLLMDGVTRLMDSLSLVGDLHSDMSVRSDMSIDDIPNLMMDLNMVDRMDMSVDDITNLMSGLNLIEHSDHKMDTCIEDITNLMKVLSLKCIGESASVLRLNSLISCRC